MININELSKYSLVENINRFAINKDVLNEIQLILSKNLFKTNKNEYITFNFYPNKTFITLATTEDNKELINSYKFFKEVSNEQLLFKDIYTFKEFVNEIEVNSINDVNKTINANYSIKFIHFTFNFDVFSYILDNVTKNIEFTINQDYSIEMYADGVKIPGLSTIYN